MQGETNLDDSQQWLIAEKRGLRYHVDGQWCLLDVFGNFVWVPPMRSY